MLVDHLRTESHDYPEKHLLCKPLLRWETRSSRPALIEIRIRTVSRASFDGVFGPHRNLASLGHSFKHDDLPRCLCLQGPRQIFEKRVPAAAPTEQARECPPMPGPCPSREGPGRASLAGTRRCVPEPDTSLATKSHPECGPRRGAVHCRPTPSHEMRPQRGLTMPVCVSIKSLNDHRVFKKIMAK